MRYPKLTVPARKRTRIDRFRGYEHVPDVEVGGFYDMENCSGERSPLLTVRQRRVEVGSLEGCPTTAVNAIGGRGSAVVLDNWGNLWCEGQALPRLLDGVPAVTAVDQAGDPVTISDPAAVYRNMAAPREYRFRYSAASNIWQSQDGLGTLAGGLLTPGAYVDGMEVRVSYSCTLTAAGQRELVFLGGWVCVFPDGRFANTAKLRLGEELRAGEDYGAIAQRNSCSQGGTLFEPCGPDGTVRTVVWADTAPESGFWVDTGEEQPTLRAWSQSQGLWTETTPYVRAAVPGIARGLRAGDSVTMVGRLDSNQGGESQVEDLWCGSRVLTAACHDPGGANREEGRNDFLVFPGLLPESYEIELTWHDQSYLEVSRDVPEMDFVVEAGNRLWGCRCGGGVNELYGSKLGDFRNWFTYEGLSTDSYRVTRGHDGPYTGAAVLGGCPLFFRADCLEKIYPSAGGDHGVVTVSLEGIEAGSARSAVVIRDRLYYKSPGGVCCYNGTLPVRVSQALGETAYHGAVAGARGSRYYVSMLDGANQPHLFVLNTETGLWHREDATRFLAAWGKGEQLYLLTALGSRPLRVSGAADSRGVSWWAETGDLVPRLGVRRYVSRLQVTARLDPGAELRVYVQCDGGPWLRKGDLRGNDLQTRTLSLTTRRCARLRLRLEGVGGMELHGLGWVTEAGSDV